MRTARMTADQATARAKAALRTSTMEDLLNMWEMTGAIQSPETPTVRGWLLDEFERREPEKFEEWLNTPLTFDSTLRSYMLDERW